MIEVLNMIEDLNHGMAALQSWSQKYLSTPCIAYVCTDNRHRTILSCKYLFFDFVDISGN